MNNFIKIDSALKFNQHEIKQLHCEYLNCNLTNLLSFLKFPRKYTKASGCHIWDDEGKEYLDFLGGFGSLNTGHNHPRILEAIEKVKHLPNLLQTSLNPMAGALAHNLAQITPGKLQRSFFCNSGAEAVEGALKLARISTGKTKILSAENSFHGKTLGALSATGKNKYQEPFKPLVPDFYHFPFGNIDELEKLLKNRDVAAVILEPIQGEGGIIIPPDGYLTNVRSLCNTYNALLILDEIQTGLGRTGKMFACGYEGVEPDIMCLAKSLGGGIFPIGAFISSDTVWQNGYKELERAALHSSTFGGNTLACAAGIAAIEVISEEGLVKNASDLGEYLISELKVRLKEYGVVKDIRGRGLFIGIEFNQPKQVRNNNGIFARILNEYYGAMVAGELLNKHNIITAYTLNNPNVIRLEPPLTITQCEIDALIKALDKVVSKFDTY